MTTSWINRLTAIRLAELAALLVLNQYFTPAVLAAASMLHLSLPEMPFVKHAYLNFALVLLFWGWFRLRGETLSDFGVIVPRHWLRYLGLGLLLFAVNMAYDMLGRPLLDPLVSHLTGTSRTLAEQHFAGLRGNLPALLVLLPAGWIFGGFGEELFFRGFLMTRIAQLLGQTRWAWIAAIFLQAIPFALGHSYQGPVGVVAIYFGSLIVGTSTILWGRNLWPAMIAHALQDTMGFLALYYGLAHA